MLHVVAVILYIGVVEAWTWRARRRRHARLQWLRMIERSVAERVQFHRAVALTADPC